MNEHTATESHSHQEQVWKGTFGKDYTDRNIYSPRELDVFYEKLYGTSRTEMNTRFVGAFPRTVKILEVGSNIGNQLLSLQAMGFQHLYGIELQSYAVEQSKKRTQNINIIQGSAFDIPFKDNYFDVVFTSGVLIHISPNDLPKILSEVVRCSKKYVWGFEYFSEIEKEIQYRENANLLWKMNYMKKYLKSFPALREVQSATFKHSNSTNIDQMFLVEKK